MSTTVDQRVVEMRFDNQNFEKNVSTTMSTLEKLKQKLNLTGASKGLEDVNNAAKKVDMRGLGNSVETVSAKFSAMQVIGTTALVNLTNQAVNAGKRMMSALTIDPVKTGFQEYETQINAVQTILANTSHNGTTIDQVNKALETLNAYADKTIYNFTEMTRNIGTFTAAGVDLDTSVNAIQGIANLAAVSGSTSQQASTAMYQLSQALAAGRVSLMDWNSVVNAGMGGKVFQDALVRTSELLGTGAQNAIDTYGSFRESLTKGEWLTTEVLTETLKQFAGAYSEADLIAQGFTEKQAKDIAAMANTAEEAATKVKTFTQLWDVLKESAQSGWSQTWKIIIGDFEEAKNLLSPLADVLTGFINKFSEARNAVLESALGKSFTGLIDNVKGFMKPIQQSADSVKSVVKSVEQYAAVVDDIIGGKWGNGQERWDKLTEAGYDWAHAQNLVNEKLGNAKRHATDYKEAQDGVAETQEKVSESTTDLIVDLTKMSDAQLKEAGYTEEQIKAFRELEEAAEKTGIPLKDFINNIDEINGRWLLINSFKNAGQGLISVFKAMGQAWREVFHGDASDEEILNKRSEALFNIIAAVHKFSTNLVASEDTINKLTRTFKGLFAIVDILTTILGGGFKIAFKIVSSILSYFNMDILDLTARIGDAIVKFRDWFDSLFDISGVLDIIVPALKKGINAVKSWIDSLKKLPGVQKAIESIAKLFDSISSVKLGNFGFADTILSAINKITGQNFESIGEFITDGLIVGLGNGIAKVISFIGNLVSALIDGFCSLLGIHSPSTVFMALGGFIIAGLIAGLKEGLISVPDSLQGIVDKCVAIFQAVDWGTIMAFGVSIAGLMFIKKVGDVLENFSAPFAGIGEILENVAGLVQSFGKVTKAAAFNIRMKGIKQLAIAIAIIAGSIIALVQFGGDDYGKMWNAVGMIVVLAAVLAGLSIAMNKLSDSSVDIEKGKFSLSGLKTGLFTMAAAVAVISGVVYLLGKMDADAAEAGFARLVLVMAGILGFIKICQVITKGDISDNIAKIGTLMIKLGIAMALMVGVCKLIDLLEPREMVKAGAFALAFGIFVFAITSVAKSAGNNVGKVGGMMIKLTIAMALMVGVCKLIDTLEPLEAIKAGVFALAFVGFVKALVKITTIGKKQQIAKLGGLLLAVSTSMLLMVGVCKLVGKLTPGDMIKGAIFAAGFAAFIWALVSITKIGNDKQIAKVSGTILGISVAIGIMAAVCMLLSLLSVEDLAKGVIAVSTLGLVMALMIKSLKGAQNVKGSLMAMSVGIALLAVAVAGLSFIDPVKLYSAVGAISIVLGMFALLIKSTKGVNGAIGPLIIMTAAIGLIAGMLWMLSSVTDSAQANIANAAALSLVMLAMAGVMRIISGMSTNIKNALTGVLGLTLIAVPMLAFVGVLALMNKIENATTNATSLVKLMSVMTLLLIPLSIIGAIATSGIGAAFIIAGILSLTAMAVPMLTFIGVLALMNKIENATSNAVLLIGLMTIMTDLLTQLAIIGPFALIGVAAAAGLTLLIGAVAGIVIALGALNELTDGGLEKLINSGIPLLIQLAEGIGTMVGKFIGCMGEAIADSLVVIGEDIVSLMESLKTASEHADGIEASSFDGVKELLDVLGDIGLTMVGMTFADIFTLGGTSMDKFKADGVAFFGALKAISAEMVGFALPENFSAEGVTTLLDILKAVSSRMMGNSWRDVFTLGEDTPIEKFKTDGIAFFGALKEISGAMTGFAFPEDFSVDGLTKLLDALKAVSSRMLGNSWREAFTLGEGTTMEQFQADAVAFFRAVKAITPEMTGFSFPEDFSVEGLTTLLDVLKKVGTSMMGVSWAEFFTLGEGTTMEQFQADAIAFFGAIKAISAEMTGFTFPEDFSVEGVTTLLDVLKTVGTSMMGASWAEFFTLGEDGTMDKFKKHGVGLFAAIKAISAEATGVTIDSFDIATSAIDKLAQIFERLKGLDYSGVEKFTGIGTGGFGADGPMHDIGVAIKDFGTQVAGIDVTAITTAVTAAGKIRTLIANLVDLDTSGIENFKAKAIGTAIKDYSTQVADIDPAVVSSSISSANRLRNFIASLVDLDSSGVSNFKLGSIGDTIKSYAGSVADIDIGVVSSSISIANRLKNFITSLVGIDSSGVAAYKSAIDSLGTVSLDKFIEAFNVELPNLSNMGANVINTLVRGIQSKQANLASTGRSIIDTLSKGIESRKALILSSINKMLGDMINLIRSRDSVFGTAGTTLMGQFVKGISKTGPQASRAIASTLTSAYSSITGYYSSFYSAGSYLVDGFTAGISDNMYKASAKAAAMATAAKKAAEEALGIASPSKVFYKIGGYTGQGFINALADYGSKVYDAGSEMAGSAKSGLSDAIGKVMDVINGNVELQPTIRPVVDLSDVQAGAGAISGLLGFGTSVGVASNLGAISSMMNTNQNGGNDDIVSAIEKLRRDLSDVGGTVYNINGITYGDDAALNDAFETILRHARMERRM